MRGFSQITGLIPCDNFRAPDIDRRRSIVADGDVVLNFEPEGEMPCVKALIRHFWSHRDIDSIEPGLFFVSGKLGVVTEEMDIGMGGLGSLEHYSMLIEAEVVCPVASRAIFCS